MDSVLVITNWHLEIFRIAHNKGVVICRPASPLVHRPPPSLPPHAPCCALMHTHAICASVLTRAPAGKSINLFSQARSEGRIVQCCSRGRSEGSVRPAPPHCTAPRLRWLLRRRV